jgi:Aldehyde dehydrogenase family
VVRAHGQTVAPADRHLQLSMSEDQGEHAVAGKRILRGLPPMPPETESHIRVIRVHVRGIGVTVFADVRNHTAIARKEIFGPVLCIIAYEDEDDAVQMGNDTLQELPCRSFDDLESEIGSFAFEIVDLQFAVLGIVKLRSSVNEWHAIAQHAIDQSSQVGRHSLNGNGSPELGSQSAKLRSKIGIAQM